MHSQSQASPRLDGEERGEIRKHGQHSKRDVLQGHWGCKSSAGASLLRSDPMRTGQLGSDHSETDQENEAQKQHRHDRGKLTSSSPQLWLHDKFKELSHYPDKKRKAKEFPRSPSQRLHDLSPQRWSHDKFRDLSHSPKKRRKAKRSHRSPNRSLHDSFNTLDLSPQRSHDKRRELRHYPEKRRKAKRSSRSPKRCLHDRFKMLPLSPQRGSHGKSSGLYPSLEPLTCNARMQGLAEQDAEHALSSPQSLDKSAKPARLDDSAKLQKIGPKDAEKQDPGQPVNELEVIDLDLVEDILPRSLERTFVTKDDKVDPFSDIPQAAAGGESSTSGQGPFAGWSHLYKNAAAYIQGKKKQQPALPPSLQQGVARDSQSDLPAAQPSTLTMLSVCQDEHDFGWEAALLRALLYKNKSQFRRLVVFRHMSEVLKLMTALEDCRIADLIRELKSIRSSDYTRQEVRVPQGEAVAFVLLRLKSAGMLCQALMKAIRTASKQIVPHLARSHFLKKYLVLISIMARTQVLVGSLMRSYCGNYNTLVKELHDFPFGNDSEPFTGEGLPEMLNCNWVGTLPVLRPLSFCDSRNIPDRVKPDLQNEGNPGFPLKKSSPKTGELGAVKENDLLGARLSEERPIQGPAERPTFQQTTQMGRAVRMAEGKKPYTRRKRRRRNLTTRSSPRRRAKNFVSVIQDALHRYPPHFQDPLRKRSAGSGGYWQEADALIKECNKPVVFYERSMAATKKANIVSIVDCIDRLQKKKAQVCAFGEPESSGTSIRRQKNSKGAWKSGEEQTLRGSGFCKQAKRSKKVTSPLVPPAANKSGYPLGKLGRTTSTCTSSEVIRLFSDSDSDAAPNLTKKSCTRGAVQEIAPDGEWDAKESLRGKKTPREVGGCLEVLDAQRSLALKNSQAVNAPVANRHGAPYGKLGKLGSISPRCASEAIYILSDTDCEEVEEPKATVAMKCGNQASNGELSVSNNSTASSTASSPSQSQGYKSGRGEHDTLSFQLHLLYPALSKVGSCSHFSQADLPDINYDYCQPIKLDRMGSLEPYLDLIFPEVERMEPSQSEQLPPALSRLPSFTSNTGKNLDHSFIKEPGLLGDLCRPKRKRCNESVTSNSKGNPSTKRSRLMTMADALLV